MTDITEVKTTIKVSDLKNGCKFLIFNWDDPEDNQNYAIAYDSIYRFYAGDWSFAQLNKEDLAEEINDTIKDKNFTVLKFYKSGIDSRIPKPPLNNSDRLFGRRITVTKKPVIRKTATHKTAVRKPIVRKTAVRKTKRA